uniref:DUF38 domain-containing protein n=1 Tax=Panagrolaimus sp. ES5 TaxID=591445 RepID=A0AC34G0S7_9BILA
MAILGKEFLLQTYSNYCRFFLDDNEMKKEYQKAVEEFGPSKVAWKNLFDFEEKKKDFNVKLFMFKKENDFVDCMENAFDLKKHFPGIKFSYRGILQQRFPFHQNFMRYVWDKANPQIRQKLLNTCKYFFAKHQYQICYKLCLDTCDEDENSNEEIVQQSLKVVYDENDDDTLKSENLWITDVLIAINKVYDRETISLAQFIPRIYRCDAKCVDIRKQVLTLDELKFLIGHGNVEDLNLANNFIINDEDGNEVALEDIAKMVPKIKFFDVASPILTATTFSTIANLTFQNKIRSMTLVKIGEELEAEAFGKFITKNFTSGSKIELYFEIEQELVLNFKQILEIVVNNHWKVEEDRPKLYILQGMDGMYSYV